MSQESMRVNKKSSHYQSIVFGISRMMTSKVRFIAQYSFAVCIYFPRCSCYVQKKVENISLNSSHRAPPSARIQSNLIHFNLIKTMWESTKELFFFRNNINRGEIVVSAVCAKKFQWNIFRYILLLSPWFAIMEILSFFFAQWWWWWQWCAKSNTRCRLEHEWMRKNNERERACRWQVEEWMIGWMHHERCRERSKIDWVCKKKFVWVFKELNSRRRVFKLKKNFAQLSKFIYYFRIRTQFLNSQKKFSNFIFDNLWINSKYKFLNFKIPHISSISLS